MRNLKLSISNIAWDMALDNDMYCFLNKVGFKGLEIAPTRIFEEKPYDNLERATEFKNNLKAEFNLEVSSMQSIWFGRTENIFRSDREYEVLIEYTKKAIDFAYAIGCSNLVFGCPKNRNVEDKDTDYYQKAIDFFLKIGDYARKKEVVIAIEPNPVIYNTNFLNTTEEAIDFVKEINMESIKVNCDLGTMIYNDEDISLVIDNIDLIHHIHISEPNLLVPEKRDMHKKLLDELERVNYANYVSIEMKKADIEEVKKIINYIIEI